MEDKSQSDVGPLEGLPGLFPRPPHQLASLPVRYRWEVTRRHPYYTCHWRYAREYYRQNLELTPAEAQLASINAQLLALIGVAGPLPNPDTDFENLGEAELQPGWLSGSVRPLSLRGMASLLIASAPAPVLKYLGTVIFQASTEDKPDALPRREQALLDLARADIKDLNLQLEEPYVAINPTASIGQLNKDLAQLLSEWKAQRDLGNQRDRSDKYEQYLKVWDLREGWQAGTYDSSRELKLKEIARVLKQPISNVANHYRNGFELITGLSYNPSLWAKMMAVIKFTWRPETAGDSAQIGPVTKRRPLKSPTRRPVPDSVVAAPDDQSGGLSSNLPDDADPIGDWETYEDIGTLLRKGRDVEEILDELELGPAWVPVIRTLRSRSEEGL
jgi:hypothetical protein